MTTSTDTIEIRHTGPTDELVLPVPAEGGLVAVVGGNDIGKSEALRAITKLVTGRGRLKSTRGYEGVGQVSGLGMHVVAGERTTQQGELEAEDLTSAVDLGVLIDPRRESPDARDAVRVKALVRAIGTAPDLSLFAGALQAAGDPGMDLPAGVREAEDPVVMASRLKAALEERARAAEGESKDAMVRHDGLLATIEGVALDAPADQEALDAAYRAAVRRSEERIARRHAHDQIAAEARAAAEKLAAVAAPTPEVLQAARARLGAADAAQQAALDAAAAAQAGLRQAEARRDAALEDVAHEYQRRLAALDAWRIEQGQAAERSVHGPQSTLERANRARQEADEERASAERALQRLLAEDEAAGNLSGAIAEAEKLLDTPTDAELDGLEEAVAAAKAAMDAGAEVRRARAVHADAKRWLATSVEHGARGDRLRRAGKAAEQVLSNIIRGAGIEGLAIVDGRLMTVKDGEPVPYDERSPGAQARLAFDWLVPLARKRVEGSGRPAVLVLEQAVYQELDYDARRRIARWAQGSGVVIYTGLATSGPLRVVVVDPDGEEGIR